MIPFRNLMFGRDWTAETRVLVAAMAVPPAGARVAQIDTLIKSLKAADVWRLLDALYLLAGHDSQAARLNWKSPGAFTLSPSNAPTFLADRGYTGDGATSGLNGPNLATFGGQYALNNAHMGVWCGTDATEIVGDVGATLNVIRAHNGAATCYLRANSGAVQPTISPATAVGHTLWSRDNSDSIEAYKNGVSLGTQALVSTSISSAAFGVCYAGTGFSTKRIQAAHVGAALTAAQIAALYAALAIYMAALGA